MLIRGIETIYTVIIRTILALLIGYFIGAIPFGVIISRLYKLDIQKVGSGNIGATNVFRNLGAVPGITVFILDVSKGAIPVLLSYMIFDFQFAFKYWAFISVGAMAIIGHMYPVYLKFKGGKGGATSLGVLIGLMPDVAIVAAITFIVTLLIARFVSASTITTAIITTFTIWLISKPYEYFIVAAIISCIIIYKHFPNIKRIISGTEPKVGRS